MAAKSDSLSRYRDKRDFRKTSEPDGVLASGENGNRFLVQKHAASRLHYDLRLELDGVLLSWAVTKGPRCDPSQKRLAVRTEDHPLSYKDFEGTIPEGEYGGGTVMLWDVGNWTPVDDPRKALAEGKLHFMLQGERMQGGWVLVRMRKDRKAGNSARENWLLIKERDNFAVDDSDWLTESHDTSVVTGRSMEQISRGTAPVSQAEKRSSVCRKHLPVDSKAADKQAPYTKRNKRNKAKTPDEQGGHSRDRENHEHWHSGKRPRFRKPELATLVSEVPEGDEWIHEHKYDGYRCVAALGKNGDRMYTRSGLDWSRKFAALESAIAGLRCESALIDGEIVAFEVSGKSAFSALQNALKNRGRLAFHVFDLLHLNGENLTQKPLLERKRLLQALVSDSSEAASNGVRYSEHVAGSGKDVLEEICKQGGEGIVSKKADSLYRGIRSRDWVKVKCTSRQEFVIGGYSPSSKRGRAFASLLVGDVGDNGQLRYRGRVGTGFTTATLASLGSRLRDLSRSNCPFESVPARIASEARWVEPQCVVEVEFTEFTSDDCIRHGVYIGRREDKMAEEVKLERADKRIGKDKRTSNDVVTVAGIRISSAAREVYPKTGITKQRVAEYYESVGPRMVELVSNTPLSLVRCPQGIGGECFYQKHADSGFPDGLRTVSIRENRGKSEPYWYFSAVAGLIAAAQMGTLEFHVWGARKDNLEKPYRLVFDLDPDLDLGFDKVKAAAFDIRGRLEKLGLASLVMVTGGKGVHVVVWLRRTVSWETLSLFARTFAHSLSAQEPERFTASMSKSRRRHRIFIDWMRNDRGATAIAPYSLRSRPGAPIAMPITWDELKSLKRANSFSLEDIASRLDQPCPLSKEQHGLQTLSRQTVEALLEERSTGKPG